MECSSISEVVILEEVWLSFSIVKKKMFEKSCGGTDWMRARVVKTED